jgi:hypothetical protein
MIFLALSSPAAISDGPGVEQLVRDIESAAVDAGAVTPPLRYKQTDTRQWMRYS